MAIASRAGASTPPRRVLFLNWRDTRHPEGGGSERYVEAVARGLAGAGHEVTVFCAAHPNAPREEHRGGVRYLRRGGKLTVYAWALSALVVRRLGRPDVIVDVQNGLPFFSRLVTRRPVVVLVHHVHREQWRVVLGPLLARLGWWLESRLAPLVYRRCQYVAVSEVTRKELVALGVSHGRIAVVHNGVEPARADGVTPVGEPTICVLGRLVPHKRVEHAMAALVRARQHAPDARLTVIGAGWWADDLRATADRLGVKGSVDFLGLVDEERKHAALARSWVLAAPSLKEGWGLAVMEAAVHGVPAVAYRQAGGLTESIVDGRTGLLVDDLEGFERAVVLLLQNPDLRARLGTEAQWRARSFSWERTATAFAVVLHEAISGREPFDAVDPTCEGARDDMGVGLVTVAAPALLGETEQPPDPSAVTPAGVDAGGQRLP